MSPGRRRTRPNTTWRSRFAAGCALALVTAAPGLAAGAPPLQEVEGVRRVCAAGPAAARARAERLRAEAAVVAAGVLPNPELVLEHQRTLGGPKEQETIAGLSVPLGIGGRRFLLQDAAEARRDEARANAHATLFEAALAFREAHVAATLDEARATVLSEQQRALDTLTAMIRELARGGESAGYALLRQETQARLHRRLVESARARAAASKVALEVWTGEEVALPPAELARVAWSPEMLPARAAPLDHPRAESLDAAARASGIEAQAARRRWVPDLALFAGYRAVTGAGTETGHGLSVGLTVPLTFFDHGQGEAAHAEAERALARASADGLRRENASRRKASARSLEILEASVADMDRAVAEAASLGSMASKLYAAGEASITELLEAFRAGEEARLARIDSAEEIARARLARMRAAGTLFDATLDKACGRASEAKR